MEIEKRYTCCFEGNGKIDAEDLLLKKLNDMIETLIKEEKVDTFLFGGKSRFDEIGFYVVTELKKQYPHITRIYTRMDFPYINGDVRDYFWEDCDDTYYPGRILNEGETIYMGRKDERIDMSGYCITYDDELKVVRNELV